MGKGKVASALVAGFAVPALVFGVPSVAMAQSNDYGGQPASQQSGMSLRQGSDSPESGGDFRGGDRHGDRHDHGKFRHGSVKFHHHGHVHYGYHYHCHDHWHWYGYHDHCHGYGHHR
ncbi:hypothetical protein [Nocardiopsis sp. FIRDI 009]|uniref:hypothetical protein n=1 Tax=Nocardiopsis sp. FIRDI 009 TaxID=714197 RepID=UPI001300814D|nr:hypothetical protein [Nocardiopsis sp. FIRDI 009]